MTSHKLEVWGELVISETRFDRPIPAHMWKQAQRLGMFKPVVRRRHNLILDTALEAFAAFTGGGVNSPTVGGDLVTPGNFPDLRVAKMVITDRVSPAAPSDVDTALEGDPLWTGTEDGPPLVDALLVITYPALGRVRFSVTVPQTQLTDKIFTEEGIFAKNGKLLARTTFSQPHPVVVGVQFDHTLTFQRVP